jgi:hypothetical protein
MAPVIQFKSYFSERGHPESEHPQAPTNFQIIFSHRAQSDSARKWIKWILVLSQTPTEMVLAVLLLIQTGA